MTIEHTPGPWEIGDASKGESPRMVYCDDSLGSRVADCSTAGHGIPTAAEIANARLIAAAPEMLEALKLAQQWLGNFAPVVTIEGQKPLPVIYAAIEKAEGRA